MNYRNIQLKDSQINGIDQIFSKLIEENVKLRKDTPIQVQKKKKHRKHQIDKIIKVTSHGISQ